METGRNLYIGADAAGALFPDRLDEAVDPRWPSRHVGAIGKYRSASVCEADY